MSYQYYNQFHLTDELTNAISFIISQKEGTDYICKHLTVTIPEHKGLVFTSPLDDYVSYGGGLNALSGAQINEINEKYGRYVEGIIPKANFDFMVIMDSKSFQSFSKLSFKSIDEAEKVLDVLSVFSSAYAGVFDVSVLSQKFPYLQEFFDLLDKWRAETNRVVLDNGVIEDGIQKTLTNIKQKSKI